MKKLNNTEIGALADKILGENTETNQKERKALETKVINTMNKLWAKFKKSPDYKLLQKYDALGGFNLSKAIPDLNEGGLTFSAKYINGYDRTIKGDFGSIYIKGRTERPSYEQIRRELILGQIDAQDLDSLIAKVKSSLKLQ
jgi:hypothetical protein